MIKQLGVPYKPATEPGHMPVQPVTKRRASARDKASDNKQVAAEVNGDGKHADEGHKQAKLPTALSRGK
jgi:hypothetical protein